MQHTSQTASLWMIEHAALVPRGASLLDVACGYGRHAKYFAARGAFVTAVDCDEDALDSLRDIENVVCELRDLEAGNSLWPYKADSFDAVLVCNYLWRPTFDALLATIKPNGILLYETFMDGHERYGKPSRPEFLLRSNELLERVRDRFQVIAFEEGEQKTADGSVVAHKQFLCARRNH